eukprot:m51a1_g7336 putative atp-dependent rna helicase uap56 (425) ;mRNA; f:192287-194093
MSHKADITELTEYDSDEDKQIDNSVTAESQKEEKQGTYVAMHSAGFKEFLLRPELLRAITDCGFEHPSEVQHQAIPQAILGTDVLCQAKSGMGKTAVFVLSILQNDHDKQLTTTVVLCPTRELAFQAAKEFDRFTKFLEGVRVHTYIGGLPIENDRARLKSECPTIVVGTPGRVNALVDEGLLDLSHVRHFVVDECDRVVGEVDMRAAMQRIFLKTPRDKQVMMFSATLPEEVRPACKKFMHSPLEIYVDKGEKLTLHGLQQYFVQLTEAQKNHKLVDLLDNLEFNQVIIFTSSCKRAEQLNKLLSEINFPSICVHSDLKQDERLARYSKFKNFQARVLVATDLFGRGVDMERINVVINYDMPPSEDAYLHRVGRAGRFGTKGLAITMVSSKEEGETLNKVQARFAVNIPELPDEIDASSYMGS